MPFNPDEYLKNKQFNPDQYIAQNTKPNIGDQLKRQAGLLGRTVIEGAAAPFASIADIPTFIYNVGAKALGAQPLPEQNTAISEALTKAGFPVPTTLPEKASNILGGAVVGGAVQTAGAKALATGATNPTVKATLQAFAGDKATKKQKPPGVIEDKLYRSAVKPSTTLTAEQQAQQLTTGLNKGIVVSKGGLAKIQKQLTSNKQAVDNIISRATERGDTIPTKSILDSIDNVSSVYEKAPIPGPYLDEIAQAKEQIASHWGDKIPVADAQDMKRLVGKLQSRAYERLKTINPTVPQVNPDIEKAIYSGIQKQLETQYPELGKLNSDSSALLSLNKSLVRAVNRITNKDIIGMGAFIKVGVGSAIGHAVGGPTGGLIGGIVGAILELPSVKSAMGIALRQAKIASKAQYISPLIPAAGLASKENNNAANK